MVELNSYLLYEFNVDIQRIKINMSVGEKTYCFLSPQPSQ